MRKDLKILFMGSPEFSVGILERLSRDFSISGVVTQPDRPSGRGGLIKSPPVKVAAEKLGIPIIQPFKMRDPETISWIQNIHPDVIIIAAFGQILKPEILDLPPFGCLNVHASLLPRWRGASPIQAALLNGDAETGVTIMKMDPGIDTGPVLAMRYIPISSSDTSITLSEKLSSLGAELLAETLPKYLKGTISPVSQLEESATYAKIIKKEDGLLDFNKSAVILERQIRAFQPWPGSYFELKNYILKVTKASVSTLKSPGIGNKIILEKYPAIGTSEGSLILTEVQPMGKKPMDGKAFLSGARNWEEK